MIAERKAALAALPTDVVARLEALHDRLEDGESLSAAEKLEMALLEQEMATASARLLQDRIRQQRSGTA